MKNDMFNRSLLAAALFAALSLTACSESAQETREDVAKAKENAREEVAEVRADAQKDVNEARQDVVDASAQNMQPIAGTMTGASPGEVARDVNNQQADLTREKADANYKIAMAQAEGDYKVDKERCDALEGQQEDACNATTKAVYEQRKADADLQMKRSEKLADATEEQPN